jgi:hypothetical protein
MKKATEMKSKFLILIILFFSCKSVKVEKEEVLGKYQYHGIYGVASNIELNKDNTFIYNWQTGLIWGTTKGNWRLTGNKLILNSDKQPVEEKDFIIRERNQTSENQFEIQVIDEKDKYELVAVSCLLMNDTTLINGTSTDVNGNCVLPFDENSNKLKFSYVGYRPVEIPISEIKSNSFIIEIKEEQDYYRYFTNREWKIRSGKIYDPEIKKSRYVKKNYYERIKK